MQEAIKFARGLGEVHRSAAAKTHRNHVISLARSGSGVPHRRLCSQQLLSAEVLETAEGCQIEVEVLDPNNSEGWESVIPANHTVYGDLERQRFYSF